MWRMPLDRPAGAGMARGVLLLVAMLAAAGGCRKEPAAGPSPKASPVTPGDIPVAKVPEAPGAGPVEPGQVPTTAPFSGFAAEGTGQPTTFQANRRATIHFAGVSKTIPCTMWFPGEEGDSMFTFSMRHDGSGYYDFVFGPGRQPCRLTDAEGNELAVMDVKFSVEPESNQRTRSTFRLTLVKP